jgi:hypothetical protein
VASVHLLNPILGHDRNGFTLLRLGECLADGLCHLTAAVGIGRKLVPTDILQIPVPTTAMVSLLGRWHNKCRPGRMPWRTKAEDCPPRGAGTRSFALIKAYLCVVPCRI